MNERTRSDDTSDSDAGDASERGFETSRRNYLRLTGAAATATLGAAAAGSAAAVRKQGITFSERVDMVDDAGCDPNGEESCHEAIMEYADDGVLLEFPAGTYRLDEPVTIRDYTSLGFVGSGDATFEFASDTDGRRDVDVRDVGEFLYEGIDWDITADNCAPGFVLRVRDSFHLEDLEVIGRGDGDDNGFALQPAVANPDGLGVVERYVAKQGSKFESAPRGGILVQQDVNYGTLRFIDCHVEEFENNGLYAAGSSGPIQVQGGVYRNNLRSQLRFCGEGSYIEGALVEVDYDRISPEAEPEAFSNARGIWWQNYKQQTGGEIRDTEIVIREANGSGNLPNSGGALVIRRDGGACTIKDTTIDMNVSPRPAVYAKAPFLDDEEATAEPRSITMENVEITGEALDQFSVQIEGRPNSVIRDCYIGDQGFRYAVVLAGCHDSVIEDCELQVKKAPQIALWGSDGTTIENVVTDEETLVIGDDDYN